MKKILLFLFSFIFFSASAQLDREHWFAPMFDGQPNGDPEQYLHLSTNETTPFNVQVYSNNTVISQISISKGNPGVVPINRNYIITTFTSELHKVVNKGLYVKADKPCFANLRFRVINHAEIITSKGTAGIGKKFYTVVAPNVQNNPILGFSASFMATENNTTVTVNNFKKNLVFNGYGSATNFTFVLNKGQSYIIDGRSTNAANLNGFIGATVEADKPISMSNGNFNGQYATSDTTEGSDILMDQTVPVDKLGDEFVIVKGYGAIGNNMEGAIVVATEKNTAIYLNDSTVPIKTLLNEGDYFLVNELNYVLRGSAHYNLHIRTDKNVYVYQLLGGVESGSSVLATGGMNYIPPLNCYLPKKIDEISYISRIAQTDSDSNFLTKLNVITEKGAVVKVNGVVPNTQYGPYDISTVGANQTWVTYSIPNVVGNITVESTKAVTAGIASGNNAFGYGGYFAGFSAIPLILKVEGDCLQNVPAVKLAVTEGFDSYLWLIEVNGTFVPAPVTAEHPSNSQFEYFPTQAGIYAVEVQQGTCPKIRTGAYKFYNCTTYTNTDFDICTSTPITPNFALSTQNLNPASVTIDTPPTKGSVTIGADGVLVYTANPNATGIDTFKYSFCGTGTLPDCETVQATIHINQIEHYDKSLTECSATGTAVFDLTSAPIAPDITVTKKYYTDAAFTNEIPAAQITGYNSAGGFIYVQLSNTFGCSATAKIELIVRAGPLVTPNAYNQIHCDGDLDGIIDGIYKVNLINIINVVLPNQADYTVRFYEDNAAAIAGGSDNLTGIFQFTGNRSIWIRVDSPAVCAPVFKEIFLNTGTPVPFINQAATTRVCAPTANSSTTINLADYLTLFTTNAISSVTYHSTRDDAENNRPTLLAVQDITSDTTFYYRINASGFCSNIGTLNIVLKSVTPSTTLPASAVIICEGTTTNLNAGPAYTNILWSTGETSTIINVGAGTYWVDLTNPEGCVYRQTVTVLESAKPLWNIAAYNGTICDNDFDGVTQVKFSDVTPVIIQNDSLFGVEYSLSPTFSSLLPNDWTFSADTTVYVRTISAVCPEERKTIDFKIGNRLTLITDTFSDSVCDENFDGVKTIDLSTYISQFTSQTGLTVTYFKTLAEAKANINSLPGASVEVTNSGTYYLRFQRSGFCDNIGTLNLTVKVPQKSTTLIDQQICPENTTTLNAGSGFTKYLWSTGETSQSIEVPVGEYWVELTFNGCIYKQNVSVTAVPLPQITNVEIQGATVTISVTGGNPPYQYSLDSSPYQASNIFTNVSAGDHTVSVISADLCDPVRTQISVIRLLNVITPNADGKNDRLDYSTLLKKQDPMLQIYDRYGNMMFKGETNNKFIWDGKSAGKAVSTGSYWYVMQWQEPGAATVTKYSGWILVKTRE